jgi:predicted MFS family arabinose efflux permease
MSTRVTPVGPGRTPLLPPPPERPPRRWRLSTFQALRHRNYRLYFAGQLVSLTGSWVQTAALTWVTYELTGQNRWTALVAAAQVVPTLLLGAWGGSLADRCPRRGLILATQSLLLALAGLLGALVLLGPATPAALLAVALAIGVVNAVDTPARLAFVIDMVGRDDLANAVALNSLQFNVARAVGPAAGAVLLEAVGAGPCFLLNGLSFLAVLAALACMRLPPRPAVRGGTSGPARGSLLEGFRHLARRRGLVLLLGLAGALTFFGWPVLSLLPDVSVKRLGAGNAGYSWMLSAVGLGALLGALTVASFGTGRGRLPLLAAGVVLAAAGLGGLSVVRSLPPALGCCALVGGGLILFFATGQAAMQLGSDDHNRGRILGIWLMVLSGAHPLGQLSAGAVADAWGVARVLALQGLGVALAAACVSALALAGRGRKSGG